MIALDLTHAKTAVPAAAWEGIWPAIEKAHKDLHHKTGLGSDFIGWVDLPKSIDAKVIEEIQALAAEVKGHSDCIISIGIGGSYLGIRATIEFLGGHTSLPLYYAGHHMSSIELKQLLDVIANKKPTVVVISKSGTTTEPALAFRVIKTALAKRFSPAELKKRIIAVTDEAKGALRTMVKHEGYRSFIIPDNVGGRFSILTPVGLVPLALAGVDIQALIDGAKKGQEEYGVMSQQNSCYQYAAMRQLLYRSGKKIEVLSSFYPQVFFVAEWFKQLFGESEGKGNQGIFPASLMMSTDLHSMGQMMQEGERTIFETFLMLDRQAASIEIPHDDANLDGFNYVAGKTLDEVNKKAYEGTRAAHTEGGVPNMTITLCKADAFHLGQLYYFFEKACGISGYVQGVNPFDQPGVEAYKKKMFALLGKK